MHLPTFHFKSMNTRWHWAAISLSTLLWVIWILSVISNLSVILKRSYPVPRRYRSADSISRQRIANSVKTDATDNNPYGACHRGIIFLKLDAHSAADSQKTRISTRVLAPWFLENPFHVRRV